MISYLQIKNIKPREKVFTVNVGNGLFLKVYPTGLKYWIVNKSIHSKRISKKIGVFPDMTIKEAKEYTHVLTESLTPKIRKSLVKTFGEIYNDWIELKKSQIKNWLDIDRRFKKYILPIYGSKNFAVILPQDLIKTIKAKLLKENKLETIKRLCGEIKQLEVYAFNCGYIQDLRFQSLNKVFPHPSVTLNNRPALHYTELKDALQELQIYAIKARATWTALLIGFYTLLRPGEYCSLEWDWIDFKNKIITLPSEIMKMKRAHRVPISSQLEILLKSCPKVSKYVLPATQGKVGQHFTTNAASKFLVDHGYKDRLVPHGIRSIGRTWMHDNDISYDVAEMCLAHKIGSTVSLIYDRSDLLDKRREAMQKWCDFVESCL